MRSAWRGRDWTRGSTGKVRGVSIHGTKEKKKDRRIGEENNRRREVTQVSKSTDEGESGDVKIITVGPM